MAAQPSRRVGGRQPACDTPQPEETLRTVRAVNASLHREQQIRVLLGDPPIRWEEVKTKEGHRKWIGMREIFPAEVVQREVLAKHRRALLVYGSSAFWKRPTAREYSTSA